MSAKERKGKIYARSATLGQEGRAPLYAQVEACTKLAESLGYVIGSRDILTEVGSGSDLDRPQMNKVRLMAANGEFDALFVDDLARLSRDFVDLLMLMREFKSRDVEVHFVQGQ
ncbi:MAG: recombinase family protein [Chloroflexi bacterium]|nr:recombinase family protein [Chloroflexota bacterium]